MKITFLGTKGYIDIKSKHHKMQSSTLFSYKKTKILIDCGETWLKKIEKFSFKYLLITHAHPDHSFGLSERLKVPVFATKNSWKDLKKFSIKKKKIMPLRKKIKLGSFYVEAFPVIHSIRCPAVGYKITAGEKTIFYAPDVVWIEDRKDALKDVDLYIGDGATIYHNMVRRSKKGELFGHATVRTQATWCQKLKVPKMIITHLGTVVVKNEKKAKKTIDQIAFEKGIAIDIAHDGMTLILSE